MSIKETAAATIAAISRFGSAYKVAKDSRAAAVTADTSTTLNNKTYSEILSASESVADAHMATTAIAHIASSGLTDTKTEFDNKISGMIPLSTVPLSRYGDASKIPVEVSGSFEGATGFYASRWMALNIEDDGTLVFLRNGTDGGSIGVYYAYSSGVLNQAQTSPQKTTRKYSPPFYPSGTYAYCVMKSAEGVVVCKVVDSDTGVYSYSISLTNGTMDDSSHKGCFITEADFPQAHRGHVEPILTPDYLYFVAPYITQVDGEGVLLKMWRIPVSSITGGNYVVPEAITGWTTVGFNNTYTDTHIKVAGTGWSVNKSADPLLYIAANTNIGGEQFMDCGMFTFIGFDKADGANKLRILCCGDTWWANGVTGAAIRPFMAYSLTVNLDAKTAAVDSGQKTATVTQDTNQSPYFSDAGTIYAREGNAIQGFFPGGNNYTSYYYHEKTGTLVHITDVNVVDNGYWLSSYKFSLGAVSKYAAAIWNRVVSSGNLISFLPKYGSAVGGRIMGGFFLPNNKLCMYCRGNNVAGNTQDGFVKVGLSGGYKDYTYKSINNGTLKGYAPSSSRSFYSDLGISLPTYMPTISYTGLTETTRLFGTTFSEGGVTSSFYEKDDSFADVGGTYTTSITDAALQSCKSQMLSLLGISSNSLAAAYVNVTLMPVGPQSHAILFWIDTDKRARIALGVISAYSGSITGEITGVTVSAVSSITTLMNNSTGMGFRDSTAVYAGAVHVFKAASGYFIGAQTKYGLWWTSNGGGARYRVYADTSGNIDVSTFDAAIDYIHYSPFGYIGVPGVGFGYMSSDVSISDNQTKLLFYLFEDSKSGFVAGTNTGPTVFQGQQVASGWIIYFTGSIPVLMNGAYGSVAPWSFDLTKLIADPSNRKLYVYVNESSGSFSYEINVDQLEETDSRMFIGTITCGATSVSSIEVVKTSRIGKWRVSTSPIGSAIPATAGAAGDTGSNLNWS